MEPEKAMDMLKYLRFFSLDSDHPAMRVYLSLAMSFINDLYLDQISSLSMVVFSLKTTKVTTLLREGLKLLAQNFFVKDIPVLNFSQKVSLLSLLGEHMQKQFQHRLLKAINNEIVETGLQLPSAIKLVCALNHLSVNYIDIENACLDCIVRQVGILKVSHAMEVTEALSGLELYSPLFLNRLADESCKEDSLWTTMDLVTLVTNCRQQGHAHSKLLSHFAGYNGDAELTTESRFEIIQYFLDCRHDVQNNAAITRLGDELSLATDVNKSLSKSDILVYVMPTCLQIAYIIISYHVILKLQKALRK